ncbi:MAG: hypothetical protein IRZ17_02355 [Mycolicibacterium hassiacum]|uniref:hypothetical protein n=1 Tax=Mycolicibacterium hassiacum TaxID=46351 RepID=UPI0023F947B2|nr:hypothetical protein [Mycolicibacterium hassiacum]MBX5485433.1 hypothetical protein [Mycolicibacterium hassiacum]
MIGAIVGRAASTVGKVLRRAGCSRLPKPERDPVARYERGSRPVPHSALVAERVGAWYR